MLGALAVACAAWSTASLEATAGIDPSWRVALHLAVLRGIDFGDGFTWTYGPLGFLTFPIAVSGGTLLAAFAFVVATQLTLAYLLVRAGGVVGVVLAYLALALPVLPADHLVLIELALAVAALRDARWARWFPAAGGLVAGLALLTKTNSGALALGMVIVVAAVVRGRALAAPAVAVVVFLIGWIASGNAISGIPGWLRLSASLVSGYSPAMQYEQPGLHREYLYAAVAAVLFAAAVILVARTLGRARAIALILVAAAFALSFFKEGFVRHDAAHSATFFAALAVASVLLSGARVLTVAVIALAVFATHRNGSLDYAPIAHAHDLVSETADVAIPHRRAALVARSRAGELRSYALPPDILGALRDHTTHVVPFETTAIAAYDLRWRPLPIVQDYSAYTHTLDEANASYLESASAPERLLRETTTESVNGRMRDAEAPAEQRASVCEYRQTVVSGAWQVLARSTPRCGPARVLEVRTAASGEAVPVPDGGAHDLVVARVHVQETFGNQIRGLLFKPHQPSISLGGGPYTQLVGDTAGDGILMHMPASAGLAPASGGATDWRTIAVGTHVGAATIEFDAYRVAGPVPPSSAARPPAHLPAYTLRHVASGDVVTPPHGGGLPVQPGGGFVDFAYERRGVLVLRGWAGASARAARTVLVYVDGRLVYAGAPNTRRPDVAAALKAPGLVRSGFEIGVPIGEVRDGVRRHVRVISLIDGRALEMTYFPSFGWR